MSFHHITLDPPYEIPEDAVGRRAFCGWTEVNSEDAPDVEVQVNGRPVQVQLFPRPQVRQYFPDLQVRGVAFDVDFRRVLAGADTQQDRGGFLLEVTVRSDHRQRTFEYAVTEPWLEAVFRRPLRARPVPPAPLQIRVTGAAAGGYCAKGDEEAARLAAFASAAGAPFAAGQMVLDFGSGPGRVLGALAPRHPGVRFHACDIDAEAIAWCQQAMAHLGAFVVNDTRPPLPYPDATFDLIYSLSTFTHMPEDLQFAWLDELRRVLKPGGLLITTIMNPFAYELPEKVVRAATETGFAYWDDAAETAGLPGFYRLAYHSHDYVRRTWARGFEVLSIGRHDLNDTQDSVLLRRI